MESRESKCVEIFLASAAAVQRSELIRRQSARDKEFAFQDWFKARLEEAAVLYDPSGRNTYPDFTLVDVAEGYEIKGLAYPGREADFDANSQAPTGFHNGRTVFYVFGRYPGKVEEDEYPVLDLVLVDGEFLNAHHEYVHQNKRFRGFGSYGDILIRDRKMYVVPTPFGLTLGTERQVTLILPEDVQVTSELEQVGELVRVESRELVIGYAFDLTGNTLTPSYGPNPSAGKGHVFRAYRARGSPGPEVSLKELKRQG